jgi:hypothetical protein
MPELSLLGFIAHVAETEHRMRKEIHEGLEKASELVQEKAKEQLGVYQSAAGPFGSWSELADATKEDRVRLGYTPNDPGRRTGEMADSIKHVVGENEARIGSDDDEMLWFELGTVKQPPRSTLGTALVREEHEVARIMGEAVFKAVIG